MVAQPLVINLQLNVAHKHFINQSMNLTEVIVISIVDLCLRCKFNDLDKKIDAQNIRSKQSDLNHIVLD